MTTEFIEVAVCTCCLLKAANGECGCVPEECSDPTERLIPGDSEGWFSWQNCEGCGSTLGGDRHQAFIERTT